MTDRPYRVLVVEDDAILREAVAEIMVDDGHEVRLAANGREALERLNGWHADLVILDVMMPVMDAFAFRDRQAGDASAGRPARVLVLSATRDVESAAERLQADAWLPKPFSLDDLSSTVDRLVREG